MAPAWPCHGDGVGALPLLILTHPDALGQVWEHSRETEAERGAMQGKLRHGMRPCRGDSGSQGPAWGRVLLAESCRVLAVSPEGPQAWHQRCLRANIYPGWRAWPPRWEMPPAGPGAMNPPLVGSQCHSDGVTTTLGTATSPGTRGTSAAPRDPREMGTAQVDGWKENGG